MPLRGSQLAAFAFVASVPAVGESPAGGSTPPGAASWRACGWGGGGFFWAAAFHPADGNVILLGGDVGGMYRTEDKGLHWRFANVGLADYAVYSIAISPSSPEIVYIMTMGGIHRSSDGGRSWRFLEETGPRRLDITSHRPHSVRALAVDPRDPDTVYAGSRLGRLYKTVDGGASWRRLSFTTPAGPTAPPAFTGKGSLVVDFDCPAADWGSMGRVERIAPEGEDFRAYDRFAARILVPGRAPRLQAQLVVQSGPGWLWQGGEFVDIEPGAWREISLDLSRLERLDDVRACYVVVRSPHAAYRGRFYLDALVLRRSDGGPARVLADWEDPGNVEGWRPGRADNMRLVTAVAQSQAEGGPEEHGVVSSIAVSPRDPSLVFAASTAFGVLRSEDAGETWSRCETPEIASCVAPSPHDTKVVYASFWTGQVMRSSDGGLTWTASSRGIPAEVSIREIAPDPGRANVVYAIGTAGWNGFFCRSTDGGESWTCERKPVRVDVTANPTLPEDVHSRGMSSLTNIAVSRANPGELFVSGNWRNVFSGDGGLTWEERSRGADITCVHDIQFSGARAYVTAMDEGLLASEDGGSVWRQLVPLRYDARLSGHQWRVRVRRVGETDRIVSTLSPWDEAHPNKVLVSEDGGRSFALADSGLPSYIPRKNCMWGRGYARALAADPRDPAVLYLGIDGDPEPGRGDGGGVFRSADGGRTWSRLQSQPASRRVFYGLVVDPTDPRRLYWGACGEGGGVYLTETGGGSWRRVFAEENWVFNLEISPTGVVYCAARNLWRSADRGVTWQRLTSYSDDLATVGIALDPDNESRIWISRVSWDSSARGGVFRTTDGGATWTDITGDLPYVKPLVLRWRAESRELWAGGVGLFKLRQ